LFCNSYFLCAYNSNNDALCNPLLVVFAHFITKDFDMRILHYSIIALFICCTAAVQNVSAQGRLTLPPDGNNQKSSVTQYIGLVKVTITYNSPNVISPSGEDRTGKIFGKLVPFGMGESDFGYQTPMPWRAGANESTTFSVSHDVLIEGKKLPAGNYALYMMPDPNEWTIIFAKNAAAWGSYFYKESDDVLRVKVKSQKAEFHQWLTYEFTERKGTSATVALMWEHVKVPFSIEVPGITEYYLAAIRAELTSAIGFTPEAWVRAAQFCLQQNVNLQEALQWSEYAIAAPYVGERTFTTLSTKAQVLSRLGKRASADSLMNLALNHPTASVNDIHSYARQLQTQGKKQEAVKVFELNARRYPNVWPTNWGLARGYAATGDYKKALDCAQKALAETPDAASKKVVQDGIEKLKAGKDIN
jgi:tetratricopeptide (TPR) repeat protein